MFLPRFVRTVLLVGSTLLGGTATFAAADQAATKSDYPLTTCVVSDDTLGGSMGKAVEYTYKQAGKPDRLILFCCKDCIGEFEKEPAKFIAKLDAAAVAAKAKPAKKS